MNHQHFTGTWRSYKAFYASGSVKKHSTSSYLEVSVDEEQVLTIKLHPATTPRAVLVHTDAWEIREVKDKFYLYIRDKQAYEVITLDADDLVLADPLRGEKIFLTQLPEWRNRMYAMALPQEQDASITIWSRSLIDLFQE